jgi:hypothetical protein
MNVTPLPDRAPHTARLSDVLAALGVDRESLIQVAGPDGLPALLWLCRQGFDHAAYVRCDAPRPPEPADALIIPHAACAASLARLLEGAPRVRAGGVLVVQARTCEAEDTAVRDLLHDLGWEVVLREGRGGRELIAARRAVPALSRAA